MESKILQAIAQFWTYILCIYNTLSKG